MIKFKQFFKEEVFDIGLHRGYIYINVGITGVLLLMLLLVIVVAFMKGAIDFSPTIEYLREVV